MKWQIALVLGACGGAIFGLYPMWTSLLDAHRDRREALRAGKPLPAFRTYFDLVGDVLLVMARAAFGGVGGVIFHTQLTSAATAGAIAVGASAPILLRQLGQIHSISEALTGASQSSGSEPSGSASGEGADEAASHA